MYGHEKSDPALVAVKPMNNARQLAAELVEARAGAEGNASQQSTRRARERESVSQALERVRQVARQRRKERFTARFHHLSIPMLRTAFFALCYRRCNSNPGRRLKSDPTARLVLSQREGTGWLEGGGIGDPLLSSGGSGKVSNEPGTASFYG